MTLDKILQDSAAWLDQATKQRIFGKIDEKALAFSEEHRQRRIADLKLRIEGLTLRKAEAVASFDRAIALEKAELDSLTATKPLQPPPRRMKAAAGPAKKKKKS